MKSLKPDYDKNNPEHVEYFMNHLLKQSFLVFNASSLKGVYKSRTEYKDVKKKLPLTNDRILNTFQWKREEVQFSDMKPLPGIVFGTRYE